MLKKIMQLFRPETVSEVYSLPPKEYFYQPELPMD